MKVIIEFYRTRETDDAHAVVGREVVDATNLANAIEIAHLLSHTLNMPQRPDAMTITDISGDALFSGIVDGVATKEGPDSDPIRR
jgi:hypothetical protein